MANFFKNNAADYGIGERQMLENRYQSYRHEIIFMVFCTVINIILLLTKSNTYFLFSAFIPYCLVDVGMFLCGKYPAEAYTGEFNGMKLYDNSVLVILCILAFIGIALYFLCWLLSKKKVGWLITALVFVSIDTVALFAIAGFDRTMIFDYVFHALVIAYLILGIITYSKLKKLPKEEVTLVAADFTVENADESSEN